MMMRIGFTGAHRTGKSTLAAMVSDFYGMEFVASSAGAIAKEYGFDFAAENSFESRFLYQQFVMQRMVAAWEENSCFVSDRTPLDAAAYLLADVQAPTGDAVVQAQVAKYVEKAIEDTRRLFDLVILVPPAIAVEPTEGKPPVNPAYQMHHHLLVKAMLIEATPRRYEIKRSCTDLAERYAVVGREMARWS